MITDVELSEEDEEALRDWIDEGSHYPCMTYEDGIKDMLEFLSGDMTIDELMGD